MKGQGAISRHPLSGIGVLFVILLSPCVLSGLAQETRRHLEFAEGKYATIPFQYPADVSVDTIRVLAATVSELTDTRIAWISHETDDSGEVISDRLRVFVCSASTTCTGASFYRFEERQEAWVHIDPRPGVWVQ